MKRLGWSLALLLLLSPLAVSQPGLAQAAKPAEKPLLRRYLEAAEADKPDLRKQLLALGAQALRAEIAAYKFETPVKTGTVKLYTACPDGFRRPMWVYVPAKYDPAKAYPLIVHMHGGVSGTPLEGEDGETAPGEYEMGTWRDRLPETWKNEVILLGVSAGAMETTRDAVWWRGVGQKNILHMITQVRRNLNIDDDHVFIEGHSDGGSGTFAFAFRRPDTFAGFFAMNGHPLVPTGDGVSVWLENLKGSSLYAVNGGADRLYPAAQLTPIYEQAKALGVSIESKTHEKLGHQITPVLQEEIEAIFKDRVSTLKRNRMPGTVDWTTDNAETGRRAWLSIDEVLNLGAKNNVAANADIKVPGRRVRLGVQLSQDSEKPVVDTVVKGSTAETMGVKEGDEITKLDDTPVATIDDLLNALTKKNPGDDVSLTVMRNLKEQVLKGKFDKAEVPQQAAMLEARVLAELVPGKVTLSVRNAGKVSIYVSAEMLDAQGNLAVLLSTKAGKAIVLRAAAPVAADAAMILDAFEATGDRKDGAIARLEFDIAKALDLPRKGKDPAQEEDDF
ncbi:MAG: PDZ domain-containing protein [Planctomycetes bacterium]|nr:PDZ domain-containing protein [Planctomycetota bacterium]